MSMLVRDKMTDKGKAKTLMQRFQSTQQKMCIDLLRYQSLSSSGA